MPNQPKAKIPPPQVNRPLQTAIYRWALRQPQYCEIHAVRGAMTYLAGKMGVSTALLSGVLCGTLGASDKFKRALLAVTGIQWESLQQDGDTENHFVDANKMV
jgi:hypothetical protein